VHKICNSIVDCPDGEDEASCELPLTCPGMLRCKVGFCVAMEYICNDNPQCPDGDDELFCDVGLCPSNCTCIGDSVNCTSTGLVSMPSTEEMKVFIGDKNQIHLKKTTFILFKKLLALHLASTSIDSLSFGNERLFDSMNVLHLLTLDNNNINILEKDIFRGLSKLQFITLIGNPFISHS